LQPAAPLPQWRSPPRPRPQDPRPIRPALIAAKLAADVAHCEAIDAQDAAEGRFGYDSDEAWEAAEHCETACHYVNEVDWKLATIPPTTLAGVAAVLWFANEIEDGGMEWPSTDTIGPDGWHYQLRATMAQRRGKEDACRIYQGGKLCSALNETAPHPDLPCSVAFRRSLWF
jgi:hypothetical protein